MSYRETVAQHLRITILRHLAEEANYQANESLLLDAVGEFGFAPSRDGLRTQLAWLAEQGLILLDGPDHCRVAALTGRGLDVAQCRATVPGVKRPNPGEIR